MCRGMQYDRNASPLRVISNRPAQRVSIHAGHHQIGDDKLRREALHLVKRLPTVARPNDVVTDVLERKAPCLKELGFIINKKDTRHGPLDANALDGRGARTSRGYWRLTDETRPRPDHPVAPILPLTSLISPAGG